MSNSEKSVEEIAKENNLQVSNGFLFGADPNKEYPEEVWGRYWSWDHNDKIVYEILKAIESIDRSCELMKNLDIEWILNNVPKRLNIKKEAVDRWKAVFIKKGFLLRDLAWLNNFYQNEKDPTLFTRNKWGKVDGVTEKWEFFEAWSSILALLQKALEDPFGHKWRTDMAREKLENLRPIILKYWNPEMINQVVSWSQLESCIKNIFLRIKEEILLDKSL